MRVNGPKLIRQASIGWGNTMRQSCPPTPSVRFEVAGSKDHTLQLTSGSPFDGAHGRRLADQQSAHERED